MIAASNEIFSDVAISLAASWNGIRGRSRDTLGRREIFVVILLLVVTAAQIVDPQRNVVVLSGRRRQLLIGQQHLLAILVAIIDTPHPADHMPKASLSMIAGNASAGHQRASR